MEALKCQRLLLHTIRLATSVRHKARKPLFKEPHKYSRYKGYTYTKPEYEQLNYFADKVDSLDYKQEEYIDKMSDVWKEMIYAWKDLCRKQDDQYLSTPPDERLPNIPQLQPKVGYENVEELKDAPLTVRRLFSAEYGNRSDVTQIWRQQLLDLVRRDKLDELHQKDTSLEAKIAYKTAQIRQWQALVDHFKTLHPAVPKLLVQQIRLSVEKRRKYLHQLRRADTTSFENVLKQLRIAYQTPVPPEEVPVNERNQWISFHLDRRVAREKAAQLSALAEQYAAARPKFESFAEDRLAELDVREAELRRRRDEIGERRGECGRPVDGEYQPSTVGEAAESATNIYWYMNLDSERERTKQQQ